MRRIPIRLRLTLAFALVMAVVFAAVGVFLYVRLGTTLDERIADSLANRASLLASSDADPASVAGEEGVAQVLDRNGVVLAASPAVGERSVLSPDELFRAESGALRVTAELPPEGEEYRLLAVPSGERVLVVGESLEDRDEALESLLAQLLVILPIALVVSAAIGYLVARAALRPVEDMRVEAAAISASELDRRLPLPEAGDEIRRLGETLNEMLARLGGALERERTFVADASHELRTPLALLKAELELALRRPRTAEELEQALRSAAVETDRLVRLAEDLLLVAQADQGRLPIRRSRVRAEEVLTHVARRFEHRARTLGRDVTVSADPTLELDADPVRLGQALDNLVDNALRHGAGAVRIVAEARDGRVELHVTDEGSGFPPDFVDVAFERFSRADEARGHGSTGLGLALVDAIARAHGGRADVTNRDGRGADVWLSLPSRL